MGAGLRLYYRHGCHLCDDMLRDLEPLSRELGLHLDVVDVDRDPVLKARYDTAVPVLAGGGGTEREICRYFLDPAALRAWARSQRPGTGPLSS